MILSELIALSKKEDIVVVLKSGSKAVVYIDKEEVEYLLVEKGKSIKLTLYTDDLTLVEPSFSSYDIYAVYKKKDGFNPFIADKQVVYYKAPTLLTFDQARQLAKGTNLLKHDDMPEYYTIYEVFEWLEKTRNVETINRILSEKRWTVKEIE